MEIILTSKRSISEQIKEKIIQYIRTGIYSPHEKLPSVRVLALELKVNPNTIAKVYAALEAEGYIYSLIKKGYYVADVQVDIQKAKDDLKRQFAKALNVLSAQQLRDVLEEAINEKENDNDRN